MSKNIVKRKNNKSFFKTRKNLFLLTGATVVAAAPITSSVAISTNAALNTFRGAYSLGDMRFGSYNELMNYVNNNSKTVNVEGNNSKWTVTLNGVTRTYNDPNVLRQSLYNDFIKTRTVKTDVDLADYAGTGGVLGLTNQDVWKHVSDNVNQSNIVYQGANDQTYSTEDEAYKSYFQTQQGYTFNGINFSTKDSLKGYLEKEYFPNKQNNQNTVVITSPSGNSLPIDLTKQGAYDQLSNFITENSELRLNYKSDDNGVVDITRNNLSSTMDQVNIKDLNYQHIQSNEGESRYILDNSDSADLIGPYFYKGILDIPSFKNKQMWKKVNGVSKSVYAESKIDSTISSFFTSIINDDNNLNKVQAEDGKTHTLLFRTLLTTTDNKSYDEWFLDELKLLTPDLADAVIKANDAMMTGKKYNSFYKIPVLYSFLMQRAISWGLGQDVINLIVNYFTSVCNFIQDILEFVSLYSKDLLLSKDKQHTFDMVKFLQIGNPEYDINTSTTYFLNELKANYPNLVAMSYAYTQAENNISLAGGLIPFESVSFDFLWESGVIDTTELYSIKNDLKAVYDTFSQLDINDMIKIYVENNKKVEVKDIQNQPLNTWSDKLKEIKTPRTNQDLQFLLSAIGTKNNQYFSLAESVLSTEISLFLETGTIVAGGYLDRLSNYQSNKTIIPLFINLVKGNEGKVKAYRVYLAFMLDIKTNSNVFNDGKTDMSSVEFARRLSYLITIVFGTSLLVSSSISKLYTPVKEATEVFQVFENPLFDWVDGFSDSTIGDSISINIGQSVQSGSLRIFNGDIDSVHSTYRNPYAPSVPSTGSPSIPSDLFDFSIQLDPLTDAIFNSSDSDIYRLINEGLTMTPIDRSPVSSTIITPFDQAEVIQASSFNDEVDLVSIHSSTNGGGTGIVGTPQTNVDFEKTKKSWWSGYTSKFQKLKEGIATVLNYALEIFSTTISILELAFFFYDLFKETYTQNFYQYTTVDGTSFYWNGGLTVSKYFGFVTNEISSIDDMKLIDPVQITLPQIEEYYYYNGLKYYNPDELKRRVLLNYMNGTDTPTNTKFTKYYALLGNEDATAKTNEELINKVINSLGLTKNDNGSFDISKLNKNSPYIQTLSASYDYGYVIPEGDNNVTLVQNILNNIRPANFVALPELGQNNIATGKAGVISQLPGKYWDGSKVVDNSSIGNVIVDNSANDLQPGITDLMIWRQENFKEVDHNTANQNSLTALYAKFKTMFSVASKELLNISFSNSKYSQLPNGVNIKNIYEVRDATTGKIFSFYDFNSATSFLNKSANFTKYTDNSGTRIYFKGMYFNNKNELLSWVHKNMVSLR